MALLLAWYLRGLGPLALGRPNDSVMWGWIKPMHEITEQCRLTATSQVIALHARSNCLP